jgi:hypothetical protein
MKRKHYRQGDVLVIETASEVKDLKPTQKLTLAMGEATGHHHTVFPGQETDVIGFASNSTSLVERLEVSSPVKVKHQEHGPIELPKGKYDVVIQSEYSPEMFRNVVD